MKEKNIYVTSPLLPPLEEYMPYLQEIWDNKWLTNNGKFHQELEQRLCEFLGVKYISLFANGTLALISALQALNIKGEVITTPYSFVATTHSLWWNGIKPVFVDIDPLTCNIDPSKIEKAITKDTTAIMPVHVYGTPCDNEALKSIAEKHNLKLIYDAAHAFAVKQNNHTILDWGDLSILSFHATKTYSTIEGGAIICHTPEMKRLIDDLKNFGFRDEVTVMNYGINAKMNELQAAFGLLSLKHIEKAIEKRKHIDAYYRELLIGINGIELLPIQHNIQSNFSYFPIFVKENYPLTRDGLYDKLKEHQIYGRRYFYPLISQFPTYQELPSSSIENLPVATRKTNEVICLPIYPELELHDVKRISEIIKNS